MSVCVSHIIVCGSQLLVSMCACQVFVWPSQILVWPSQIHQPVCRDNLVLGPSRLNNAVRSPGICRKRVDVTGQWAFVDPIYQRQE